ncbi:AAA family ATPase [Thermoplasmatales archaeon ex4572_165]|nr:MAG: AAA family ATPase [Thermoplasmatales archaeon ex4572_165]RLF57892.1 MAG: ATP-binding protein [Thermoplasmata archaeon]
MNRTIRTILGSWIDKKIPKINTRNISLEPYLNMNVRKIIVLTGFRRVGKTFLLLDLAKHLLKQKSREEIVYINFDDERIPESTAFLTEIIPSLKQTFSNKTQYLFLDEIQDMPKWGQWLRRIYDTEELNIFIAGSSSKVSSREIPTELRGRCLEIPVFPLSFPEFLQFKQKQINTKHLSYSENELAELFTLLDEYLTLGGMPEIVIAKEAMKQEILQQYYGTVVRKDIIERFHIQNEEGLKALLLLLLNSTQYSISKLYKTLKSLHYPIGKTTIQNYLNYVETSYFIHSVPIFSYSIKDQLQYPRKHYFIDNGFITSIATRNSKDYGRLYENLVAITLLRKTAQKNQNIFYWKNQRGLEVDFVIKDELQVNMLIQVCYDIEDYDTKKRETTALIKASEKLNCMNLMIITRDVQGEEIIKDKKIIFKPLYQWLLEDNKNNIF